LLQLFPLLFEGMIVLLLATLLDEYVLELNQTFGARFFLFY